MPPPLPHVHSFLLADQVFQQTTGKWCVIGEFNRILAKQYPTLLHSLGLFVKLTDAEGEYEVRAEFRDSKDRVLAIFGGLHLAVPSRLASAPIGIQTHNLAIPSPGVYFIRLYFNGQEAQSDIKFEASLFEENHGQPNA